MKIIEMSMADKIKYIMYTWGKRIFQSIVVCCFITNPTYSSSQTLTIFLIDGLSQNIFSEELKKKNLDNIQNLINEGQYIKYGIASFPSMTGYGFYPLITGIDAAESGVLGLRWFDRNLSQGNFRNYVGITNHYMNKDILPAKTIFEMHSTFYTVSINSYMNRGVKESFIVSWPYITSKFQDFWLFKLMNNIPFIGTHIAPNLLQTEDYIMKMAIQQLKRNPKVHWISLGGLDAYNHVHGTDHNYTKLLIHIDKLIGKYIMKAKQLKQNINRIYIIASDHGVRNVHTNLSIVHELQQKFGLRLEREQSAHIFSSTLDRKLTTLNNLNNHGYFLINGNLMAYIYLKNPYLSGTLSWRSKIPAKILKNYPVTKGKYKKINLLEEISKIKGVNFASYREGNHIYVVNKRGTGIITHKNGRFKYAYKGMDPFLYAISKKINPLINNGYHTKDKWLSMTYDSEYPDAIYRLFKVFNSDKCADIILTSKKGYDFGQDYEAIVGNFRGGHGSLHADVLRVPYILKGKGIDKQKKPYARAEDIGLYIIKALKK